MKRLAPNNLPARLDSVTKSRTSPGVNLSKSDRLFLQSYRLGRTLADTGAEWARLRSAAPYKNDDSAAAAAGRKLSEIRAKCERGGVPEMVWEELGLGMKDIAWTLAQGMRAMIIKPMIVREETVVRVCGSDGKERDQVVRNERIVEVGPYADNHARNEAARIAASLRGDIIRIKNCPDDVEVEKPRLTFIFNIPGQKGQGV